MTDYEIEVCFDNGDGTASPWMSVDSPNVPEWARVLSICRAMKMESGPLENLGERWQWRKVPRVKPDREAVLARLDALESRVAAMEQSKSPLAYRLEVHPYADATAPWLSLDDSSVPEWVAMRSQFDSRTYPTTSGLVRQDDRAWWWRKAPLANPMNYEHGHLMAEIKCDPPRHEIKLCPNCQAVGFLNPCGHCGYREGEKPQSLVYISDMAGEDLLTVDGEWRPLTWPNAKVGVITFSRLDLAEAFCNGMLICGRHARPWPGETK